MLFQPPVLHGRDPFRASIFSAFLHSLAPVRERKSSPDKGEVARPKGVTQGVMPYR